MAPLGYEPIGGQTPQEAAASAAAKSKEEEESRKKNLRGSIAESVKKIIAKCSSESITNAPQWEEAFLGEADEFAAEGKSFGYFDLQIGDDERFILPDMGSLLLRPDGKVHRTGLDNNYNRIINLVSDPDKNNNRFELIPGVMKAGLEKVTIQRNVDNELVAYRGTVEGKTVSLAYRVADSSSREKSLQELDSLLRLETGPRP